MSNLYPQLKIFTLSCLLLIVHLAHAQKVRVIDNKGTIQEINNNTVTTNISAPAAPLEGDVWFDISGTSTISKIYDTTGNWLVIDVDAVTTATATPAVKNMGDIWFDTNATPNILKVWDGNTWLSLGNNFWSLTGNSGTNATTDFAGTTDAQDFVFKANNIEKLRLVATKGQVLVNQATSFNDHPLVIKANGDDVLAFQDNTGVPKWHWNLLNGGLNFVESNVLDYRLFLQNGGKIGINTSDPQSILDINGSVSTPIMQTTANFTATDAHHTIILGDNHMVTLPAANTCEGRIYVLKNPNSFATAVSAYTNLEGVANILTLNNKSTIWLQSDNAVWQQISGGNNSNYAPIKNITSNYTLLEAYNAHVITVNSATDVTLTLPAGLLEGFNVSVYQTGVGKVLFVGAGTTLKNRLNRFKTAGLDAGIGIIATATDIFHLTGDLKR